MTPLRSSALALVEPPEPSLDTFALDGADLSAPRGRERRAHARLTMLELPEPLTARLKYGESVRLVDVSAGGALFETVSRLRPDADLVLEVGGPRGDSTHVVSRVLRCEVAAIGGGIRYRGACAFKRPLAHPALVSQAPLLPTAPGDFVKLEFALKSIAEGYVRRAASGGSDDAGAGLLLALARLKTAAERRGDPVDRQLAALVASMVAAFERGASPAEAIAQLQEQLRRHVPLVALRGTDAAVPVAPDRELVTLQVLSDPAGGGAVTAEFPLGFGLDEPQFRLLKASAYLHGLAERWSPPAPPPAEPAPEAAASEPAAETAEPVAGLPVGWRRIVVRFVDGTLLRGYTNDFHPDRPQLHLCPTVLCPAAERLLVPIARLKAVFFVRDLHGNAEHVETNEFDHVPRARRLEVTFRDGEVMIGSTLNYKPHGQGFYLTPANSRGNNTRIYVVTAAVRHMRFV